MSDTSAPQPKPESDAVADGFRQQLRLIEQHFMIGDATALGQAGHLLNALDLWVVEPEISVRPDLTEIKTALATARAHWHRLNYRPEEAYESYERGLSLLQSSTSLPAPVKALREANLHTYMGLTRLLGHTPEAWTAAGAHFETSIHIREAHPDKSDDALWGLSAAWINRGDVWMRLAGESGFRNAIPCYEKGAEVMQAFDLEQSPQFRARYALCHINIAGALLELAGVVGNANHAAEIEANLQKAIELLRHGVAAGSEECKRVLAVALTNLSRARLILDTGDYLSSENEAREALDILHDYDLQDWELLKLNLTARISLCLSLDHLHQGSETISEISDVVEQGLSQSAAFFQAGGAIEILDPLLGQLFRNGADYYRQYQPHFLVDFILDYLDPSSPEGFLDRSPACHEAAVEILWRATAEHQPEGFAELGTKEYDQKTLLLNSWHDCREQLAAIRSSRFI